MGKTKQELVSDIELRVTRAKPSDDLELEQSQIVHWLEVAANSVVADYLNKKMRSKKIIPPEYIEKVLAIQLTQETAPSNTDDGIRHYLDFSSYNVMPLEKDQGIVRVTTLSGKRVNAVRDEERLETMQNLYFSKPSRENLLWYREGDEIFVSGYGNEITSAVKLNVYYVPVIEIDSLIDTAEVQITDDLVAIILDVVEDMALRQLGADFEDLQNDGTQA
jgi:hypothetical protein